MSPTFYCYDRESFLAEFFPDASERAEVEAGANILINQNRAHRLADQSALALQQLRRIRQGNQLPIDGILAEDLVREDRDR